MTEGIVFKTTTKLYLFIISMQYIYQVTRYLNYQQQQVHIYRPQRSCSKVIFSQACVKNSVHGGRGVCLSACWDTPPWTDPPHGQTPPPPSRRLLQRTVRILLECILVPYATSDQPAATKPSSWTMTLNAKVTKHTIVDSEENQPA